MKKFLAFLMAFAVIGSVLAGCGGGDKKKEAPKPAADGGKKFINIATGGTAGTYYPLGGALADILNKNVKGANASAQSRLSRTILLTMLPPARKCSKTKRLNL